MVPEMEKRLEILTALNLEKYLAKKKEPNWAKNWEQQMVIQMDSH